ncbi:MAG: menaquinone biosynthesis protein, partial [Bacteroidota bacterium]
MLDITLVSYLNTLPFLHGLSESGIFGKNELNIIRDNPANCVRNLLSGKAKVGLVPVAAIQEIPGARIITDYCLGAEKRVRSVILAGNIDIKETRTILLDYQSRTSNKLVKILCRHHWNISPDYEETGPGYEDKISGTSSGVIIGDRAMQMESKFPFVYDLAFEWNAFTNLPFVFACWVAVGDLAKEEIQKINSALSFGLSKIDIIANNDRELLKYLT